MQNPRYHPLVSIVIPVYNGSNYLREAVASALAQTYGNIEIIVVNDGSDDDGKTDAIARSYGGKIRYLLKDNGGVASAINAAISNMHGEYFSWLSHDDYLYAEKIEKLVDIAISRKGEKIIAYSRCEDFLQKKRQIAGVGELPDLSSLENILKNMFCPKVNISSMLIPKKTFDDIGVFDELCVTTQDYDFIFRMAAHGYHFMPIDAALTVRRVHEEQGTAKLGDVHIKELEFLYLRYIEVFFKDICDMPLCFVRKLCHSMFERGLFESARRLQGIISWKEFDASADYRKYLWLYWENKKNTLPPQIILDCWRSIYLKCKQDFSIINLDDLTIRLFLHDFPEHVWKFSQIAHRADYFRFALLEKYGGIWLDSDTMVLKNLLDISVKLGEYDFICTGYDNINKKFFPLISFLASRPRAFICEIMVKNYHDYFQKNSSLNTFNPLWDQLGGDTLSTFIGNNPSILKYDERYFYPIQTWRHPQRLFMPPDLFSRHSIYQAYVQSMSYSAINAVYDFFNKKDFLSHLNLGIIRKIAFSNETHLLHIKRKKIFIQYLYYKSICTFGAKYRKYRLQYKMWKYKILLFITFGLVKKIRDKENKYRRLSKN